MKAAYLRFRDLLEKSGWGDFVTGVVELNNSKWKGCTRCGWCCKICTQWRFCCDQGRGSNGSAGVQQTRGGGNKK